MIQSVVEYLDLFLKPLGFRPLGLAAQVIVNELKIPATYAKNGEVIAVNVEPNTIYHRIISMTVEREDGSIGCSDVQKRTYRMRLFASFDRELICQDSIGGVDAVISNFVKLLNNRSIKSVKQAYGLNLVSTFPLFTYREKEAWDLEFGKPFYGKEGFIAIDYTVAFKGVSDCFEVLTCDSVKVDVLQLVKDDICEGSGDPATFLLNGVEVGTAECGGSLDVPVEYENGTEVGELRDGIYTIPDPEICEGGNVLINGVQYGVAPSVGFLDVPVLNTDSAEVGTPNPGVNVIIGDATVLLNGSPYGTVPAEGSIDVISACDPAEITTNGDSPALSVASGAAQNINIHNSANADIGVRTGDTVNVADMTLDFPDGTTQALMIVPGSTVSVPPHWQISFTGTVVSPVTIPVSVWDSPFVCTAFTFPGATIVSLTINGGAPIATPVGASFPSAATLVLTFTGTPTTLTLTF